MSGPGVPIFSRFKGQWEDIKHKPYSSGIEDNTVAEKIPAKVQEEMKFVRFGLPLEFIATEPEIWEERDDYQQAKEILRKIHVVNDAAERGVKLIEEYNNVLCRNEEEKIFLLQVVAENRKKYPSHNKNELI